MKINFYNLKFNFLNFKFNYLLNLVDEFFQAIIYQIIIIILN
jgi:hypothetical protein